MRGKVLNELASSLLYALQHFSRRRVIAQAAIAVLAAAVLLLTGLLCRDKVFQEVIHSYTLLSRSYNPSTPASCEHTAGKAPPLLHAATKAQARLTWQCKASHKLKHLLTPCCSKSDTNAQHQHLALKTLTLLYIATILSSACVFKRS